MFKTALLVVITAVLTVFIPRFFEEKLPVNLHIFTAPGWEEVGEVYRQVYYMLYYNRIE